MTCRLLTLLLCLTAPFAGVSAESPRPHVVFLLADDLGFGDVGWHDSEIRTPHLDALAASGAKLERFYVQPVCSPTRASLMTGRYPMRYGLQVGVIRPHERRGLSLAERLLPQALHDAGYATHMVGKWHLGFFEPAYLPTQRGFDHHYGHYCGALDYFTHLRDGGLDWHRDTEPCHDEGYTTELVGAEAARIIENHDASRPLFLYVPFNAPHSPLQAPEAYLAKYENITDKKRRAYAAMVTCEDEQVGRILAALAKKGLRDNTLVIFSSDNGGPTGLGATNGPLRAGKGTVYEGGTRVTACASWPGKIAPGSTVTEPLHMVDWFPTLLGLAGASAESKLPLDGHDIWPVLTSGAQSPHEFILHNASPSGGALSMGDWKVVIHLQASPKGKGKGKNRQTGEERTGNGEESVELFNLRNDPGEKIDLASQEPAKTAELLAKYHALAAEAVPPGNLEAAPGFKVPAIWGPFGQ